MKIRLPRLNNANVNSAPFCTLVTVRPTSPALTSPFTLTSPLMSLVKSLPSSPPALLLLSFSLHLRCLLLALVALLLGLALPLLLSLVWDLTPALLPLSNLPLALDPAPVLAPLLPPLRLLSLGRCHLLLNRQVQPRPHRPANPRPPLLQTLLCPPSPTLSLFRRLLRLLLPTLLTRERRGHRALMYDNSREPGSTARFWQCTTDWRNATGVTPQNSAPSSTGYNSLVSLLQRPVISRPCVLVFSPLRHPGVTLYLSYFAPLSPLVSFPSNLAMCMHGIMSSELLLCVLRQTVFSPVLLTCRGLGYFLLLACFCASLEGSLATFLPAVFCSQSCLWLPHTAAPCLWIPHGIPLAILCTCCSPRTTTMCILARRAHLAASINI